jgi:hypothetical protein
MLENVKRDKKLKSYKMQTIITELNVYVAWCLSCVTPCFNLCSAVVTHCSLFIVEVGRSITGSF